MYSNNHFPGVTGLLAERQSDVEEMLSDVRGRIEELELAAAELEGYLETLSDAVDALSNLSDMAPSADVEGLAFDYS